MKKNKILVTGGAGFIGSALIRNLVESPNNQVLNIDKLTYAGNLFSLKSIESYPNYFFQQIDICDKNKVNKSVMDFEPDTIMHLAAESHVDNSIISPSQFISTNIVGTYNLLVAAHNYWTNCSKDKQKNFIFHHISTDEVYGDLELSDDAFTESSLYKPSSPYSASKAGSDHLVYSWHRTFNLPTLITNCSNNYGPYHHPEKLIPQTIINCILGKEIPIYGDGSQIRDWLYVGDHISALKVVVSPKNAGKRFNIGGNSEKTNLDVVRFICNEIDVSLNYKDKKINNHAELIKFVDDRPGHDKRYAINTSKINKEQNWFPKESFESGLKKTIRWYIENQWWWESILKK